MSPTRSLLHPGFAKAGSTFLQEWFQWNPHLRFTVHSVGGFDNVFQLAEAAHQKPDKAYRYFVTSNELLGAGGKIPYGCALYAFRLLKGVDLRRSQKQICRLLQEIFPDSKVVIVTRGFGGIIRSLYSQYIKLGGRRDFADFLSEYTSILRQWLDVDYNLGLYREAFGDGNVLVFPYELLQADSKNFLIVLERFLELEHVDHIPAVKNPSLPTNRMYWYSRLSRYVVTPFADMFSLGTAGRVYSFYSAKVVQPDRLGQLFDLISRVYPRSAALEFPVGYLGTFRGLADSLAADERYRSLADEYLFTSSVERRS